VPTANPLRDEPAAFLERLRRQAPVTPTMPTVSDAERLGLVGPAVGLNAEDDVPSWT
jgi:hypothetical protein